MIGFLGPWFCSLFFNTSSECKKQTHLEAHTYPHLAEDALNRGNTSDKECWITILKVGPFEKWEHALTFRDLWASHTRGKMFRLERGIHLFKTYKDTYNLKLWAQTEMREEALRRYVKEEKRMDNEWVEECEEEEDEEEVRTFESMYNELDEVTLGAIDAMRAEIERAGTRKRHKPCPLYSLGLTLSR